MVAILNDTIEHSNEVMSGYAQSNQLAITLTALDEIARHMTGVPGRKNLIRLTGSLPFCLCQRDQNLDPCVYAAIRVTERMLSSQRKRTPRTSGSNIWKCAERRRIPVREMEMIT